MVRITILLRSNYQLCKQCIAEKVKRNYFYTIISNIIDSFSRQNSSNLFCIRKNIVNNKNVS